MFLSPWLIGFLAFTLYPMVVSLYYSFTIYHSKRAPDWVGLQNYNNLFTDDKFWISLNNTLYMVAIAVPLGLLASFLCAILLNLKVRGQAFYRVVYFLPSIVPTVAGTILFLGCSIRRLAWSIPCWPESASMDPTGWLTPNWSKPALILLGMWGMGGTIIIYLSGLQDVPVSLIEAAELDGANWFQRLWHITIPMVSPITLFNLITGMIGMFQYFAQAYVVGGGDNLGRPAQLHPFLLCLSVSKRLPLFEDGLRLRHGVDSIHHHFDLYSPAAQSERQVHLLRGISHDEKNYCLFHHH